MKSGKQSIVQAIRNKKMKKDEECLHMNKGGMVDQEEGDESWADFLSHDDEEAAFPEVPYDMEDDAEEMMLPENDNNKKARIGKIMKAMRMGKLKGKAAKEDKY